ncbi:MAG TPA: type II toxin-antitoxin system VapC family toxin [Spirochaetales bacterium]|nr:type II toxin-antitoxin system VapC family toxin [Spirochaetales bacterium]
MKPVYLLDTNVVSELVRPAPDRRVLERFAAGEGRMAIPSIVWHELLYGMSRLPDSRRRDALRSFLMDVIAPSLPVLPYDGHAAWHHAVARAALEARGEFMPFADGQIAATAVANNLVLVTRNLADFRAYPSLMLESWFE